MEEKLDKEKVDHYRLQLGVYDGGSPSLSDSISVHVRVLDANDNDPVFERHSYDVTVVENAPLYGDVITVRAEDLDSGDNGRVRYGFTAQTEALYDKLFAINSTSGRIYLRGILDREVADTYQVWVSY